jgi:tetratricopeptide (TPR) repeat protein
MSFWLGQAPLRAFFATAAYVFARKEGESAAIRCCGISWDQRQAGNLRRAIFWGKGAIICDPSLPDAYTKLGNAYARSGRAKSARTSFERGLEIAPDYAWLHCDLGYLELQENRPIEAEAYFRRALDLQPGSLQMLLGLADSLLRQSRDEEAAQTLEEAHRIAPDDSQVLCNLGYARLGRGEMRMRFRS